jgi:thiosulfate/3-mercaptopyruvate sulfurtransferase
MSPASLPLLLAPEALYGLADGSDVVIVDAGQEYSYRKGHIPGAVWLPAQALILGTAPAPGLLPPREHVAKVLAWLGIGPDTHVVAYDDEGGGWAGRFLWALESAGLRRYSLLDGGIHAWIAAGFPLDTDERRHPVGVHTWPWDGQASVDLEWLRLHLDDPDLVIWDARSTEEYLGTRISARRNGHIPGAVHFEWTRAMNHRQSLRLREPATLRQELASLGIHGAANIVTHCHSHHRSGFTWILGRILGFPRMHAYPGAWSEWGNHPETAVVSGPQRY